MAVSMKQSVQAAACSSSGRVAVRMPFSSSRCTASHSRVVLARSHKVDIEHDGKIFHLEVPEGKTILEVALDKGMDLPHDCKLGVCMTCPAKLVSAGTMGLTFCTNSKSGHQDREWQRL